MQRIVPAILTQDSGELERLLDLFKNQSKWLHIDIMDGLFVPNTSINLFQLDGAYEYFNLEIHLMVKDPPKYFSDCREVGAKRVIFHAEAVENKEEAVEAAKKHGLQVGIATNPETDIADLGNSFDSLMIMGVHPGSQGHEFVATSLNKLKRAKEMYQGKLIGMDGGVSEENVKQIFENGADYVVIGSNIVQAKEPLDAFQRFQSIIA